MALVSSPRCNLKGYPVTTNDAVAYSKNCYGADPGKEGCSFFRNQSISFSERSLSTCPFPGQTCGLPRNPIVSEGKTFKWYGDGSRGQFNLAGAEPALVLDTGFVDVRYIGINTRLPYHFRRTTTCAPLVSDGEFIKSEMGERSGSSISGTGRFYGRTEEFTVSTVDKGINLLQ